MSGQRRRRWSVINPTLGLSTHHGDSQTYSLVANHPAAGWCVWSTGTGHVGTRRRRYKAISDDGVPLAVKSSPSRRQTECKAILLNLHTQLGQNILVFKERPTYPRHPQPAGIGQMTKVWNQTVFFFWRMYNGPNVGRSQGDFVQYFSDLNPDSLPAPTSDKF